MLEARRKEARARAEDRFAQALVDEAAALCHRDPSPADRAQEAVAALIAALRDAGRSLCAWAEELAQAADPDALVRQALKRAIGRRGAPRDPLLHSVTDKLHRVIRASPEAFSIDRAGRVASRIEGAPPAPPPPRPQPSRAGGSFRHAPDAAYAAWLHHQLQGGPAALPELARKIVSALALISLDAAAGHPGAPLAEVDPGDFGFEDRVHLRLEYRRRIEQVSPVDARLHKLHIEEGYSLREAAAREGVTVNRVRTALRPTRGTPGAGHG